jgi:hypothetical protein
VISPTKTAPTIVTNALPGESQAFTLKATGKAFRILIDGLYENKQGAVVREIMSNAWDSHAAAGCLDVPIKVTCPTDMDPIFRVRDFGVSMTHEQVMHLYTTIFESTKESTNDQLGQFGLGSKTPFAYTDSFTVTAWLAGEKRSYVAYVADDDVPVINHVGTEPQGDEPQGIEISVPVRPADLRTFKQEIAHMVMSSDVLPELDGMKIADDLFVHEGDGYRIVRDHYSMGQFAVRQGCVVYPSRSFNSHYVNYGYTLIIDVPIGSVDVTANREAMSLNDVTRRTVEARLNEVNKQIETYIQELNDSFPNRLAAHKAFASHEGWLRAAIGRRTVGLQPDKPNRLLPAQQLDCYYTKTKTRPQYQFTGTGNIRLLVDNGEPMLRRNLRLGQYYEQNRRSMVAVVKPHELPRLVRVLGLSRSQVRTLQTIDDVDVVRVGNGVVAGKHAAPKTLAAGTYWMPKMGVKTVNARIGGAYIGTPDDLDGYYWAPTLKALGIDRSKIVFLTEKQAETLQAPENMRLDKVLAAAAQAYATKKGLVQAFKDEADHSTLDSYASYWKMQTVINHGFKVSMPDSLRNGVYDRYLAVINSFRPTSKRRDFNDVETHVSNILEIGRSGGLTPDAIESKVVSEMKPLAPLFKSTNPMGDLVSFYLANQ